MKYLKYFENNIDISKQKLKTLKGLNIPKYVGYFYCNNNQLTSLEFCPEQVDGDFYCRNNQLTSLKYCPEYVGGDFDCSYNLIISLEFCPKTVDGDFSCNHNKLTSLEHCPETINGYFSCSYNKLTSLKYCPKTIDGNFYCYNNNLTSLEFLPKHIKGYISVRNNDWKNPIPYEIINTYVFIDKNTLYTDEQKEKFGSYKYQKEFLTNTPEKYKDLEPIGYNKQIKDEFDWLFNAIDMELM